MVKTTAQRFSLNVLLAETQALEAAIGAAIGAEGRVRVNSSEMHFLVTLSVDGCDTLPSSRVITWVRGAKIVESEHLVIVHEGYAPPAATDGAPTGGGAADEHGCLSADDFFHCHLHVEYKPPSDLPDAQPLFFTLKHAVRRVGDDEYEDASYNGSSSTRVGGSTQRRIMWDDSQVDTVVARGEIYPNLLFGLSQKLDRVLLSLDAQFRMLSTMLKGVENSDDVPQMICLVPVDEKGPLWRKAFNPKNWFNQKVHVYFFDPIRLTHANTRDDQKIEILFAKEWVKKAMPYAKLGLTALKLAAIAGRLAGVPVPDFAGVARNWIDEQLSAFKTLKDKFVEAGGGGFISAVDERCEKIIASAKANVLPAEGKPFDESQLKALGNSAKDLIHGLPEGWKEKCGLTRVTANDGETAWVLPDDEEEFVKKGKDMLANPSHGACSGE